MYRAEGGQRLKKGRRSRMPEKSKRRRLKFRRVNAFGEKASRVEGSHNNFYHFFKG